MRPFPWRRLAAVLVVSVLSSSAAVLGADALPAWRVKMERLAAALGQLLPDLASERQFQDPRNRQRILGNVRTIVSLAHQMKQQPDKPQADPTLGFIMDGLEDEAREAEWALRNGNLDYARAVMFNVANACIVCHSRNSEGVFFRFPVAVPGEEKLSRFERATLHAAMRRFDQALTEYQDILRDPRAPLDEGLEWDRAVNAAVALAVRSLRSPEAAASVTEVVMHAEAAPPFLRTEAASWREAIQAWKREAPSGDGTEAARHARGKALLERAQRGQSAAVRPNYVELLRATTELHDQLNAFPNGPLAADALLLLGMAYSHLEQLEQWTLHPMYFQACIRKRPHSSVALDCYARYAASMHTEYTGSGNPNLPGDVVERLKALAALAR
ncbi:MAG: hypothetical protein AB2A00_05395 [Myxococcota bacterium]